MPFKKIDLDAKIEEQKNKDPEFAKLWDETHQSEKVFFQDTTIGNCYYCKATT